MRIFASRQCADYVHASYVGAGEAHGARVTFAKLGITAWERGYALMRSAIIGTFFSVSGKRGCKIIRNSL